MKRLVLFATVLWVCFGCFRAWGENVPASGGEIQKTLKGSVYAGDVKSLGFTYTASDPSWISVSATISFSPNQGTSPGTKTFQIDAYISVSRNSGNLSRNGTVTFTVYDKDGYYGGRYTQQVSISQPPPPSQTVTFNANGGSCSTDSKTYTIGGTYGSLPTPTRLDYKFDGWWTAASGGTQITATSTVTTVSARTLYAHWIWIEPTMQKVTFDANGGSFSTGSGTYTGTYTIGNKYGSLPTATREEYIFDGWWTASSGGSQVTENSTVTAVSLRTLYAHWIPTKQTVTFNANGGSCSTGKKTYPVGTPYGTLPTATRSEYTFSGWWTAASGGTQVFSNSTVTPVSSLTLYAHWTPINQTVTFDANGGSCTTSTLTYLVGTPYGTLPTAMRTDYVFNGWWTAITGGTQVRTNSTVSPNATLTLFARWRPIYQTVTFDANGGICPTNTQTYTVWETYGSLPTAERSDYSFNGWWTAASGGQQIEADYMVSADVVLTLYAHWIPTIQTVTFDANGGSCLPGTRRQSVGDPYGGLPTAKPESIFLGWWTARSGGTQITESSMVTKDSARTLYAHWKKNLLVLDNCGQDGSGECKIYFCGDKGGIYALQRSETLGESVGWTNVDYALAEQDSLLEFSKADYNSLKNGYFRITKVAGSKYMVVDMSAGASAALWPVSWLMDEPEGGWTDEYKTSKLVLRFIPPGTFTMGSPLEELERSSGEVQHEVTLSKPFYMGVFEVTQEQWQLATSYRPSWFRNTTYYKTRPVELVSYRDIQSAVSNGFFTVLRKKTGRQFDLPTEAQWEYACRAGTRTAFNSGKELTRNSACSNMAEVGRYGWNSGYWPNGYFYDSTCGTSNGTAKVGSYEPNAWGLYDMHGNVWEWCRDWFEDYDTTNCIDPVGPAKPASTPYLRVVRGGSWSDLAQSCRSAYRNGAIPTTNYNWVGFRPYCNISLP